MIHAIHVPVGRAAVRCRAAIAAILTSFFSATLCGGATLTWNDNSANEAGFRIERALADLVFVPLATVARNVTSYVDATALPSTVYYYRVAAVNASGASFSNIAASAGSASPNTAPTISSIGDQSMIQGTASVPIGFSVGDAETSPSALIVTAFSSNATLVPLTGITLAGTGSDRTITVTPAAGQLGTATITVTVSDGVLLANETFLLTVTGTNTAPTISQIPAQSINEDTSTVALAFSVGDAQTPAASLIVTAASSNPALVPLTNIVLGGSNANRTVTISPVPNLSGIVSVTLTVSDGTLNTATSFALTVNAVNDAPTIGMIANQATNEDTPTTPIAFTVGDIETPGTMLVVTGTSSNTALVPNSAIVLGGSGTNRTVSIAPAPNQSGTSQITISVSDGQAIATRTFLVTVNPLNDAPTISAVANQSTSIDTPLSAIAFSVDDLETPAANLSVSGNSSNPTLFPEANLVFGGSGTNRSITISPAAGQTGTATITLTVSDGLLTQSSSFEVTVGPGDTAPTISSIANQTIKKGGTTGSLAFTISDAESPAGNLTVVGTSSDTKLVPPSAIVFGGSGGNRTVAVTPFANRIGTATITVIVSDGILTATRSFLVTVQLKSASMTTAASNDSEAMTGSAAAERDPLQLSALGPVSEGNPLIAGFVVEGEVARTVLVRGVGPGLAQFGVGDPLAAPLLQVYDAAGVQMHASGAWGGDESVAEAFARTGRFPLAADSADAATLLTLIPGVYTVHVTDGAGSGGTALLEILDAEAGTSRVVAESARANIATDHPLTTGLVVGGSEPKQIVVRGIGSTLAQWGVLDPIESPVVTVYDRTGGQLARNAAGESRATPAALSSEWRNPTEAERPSTGSPDATLTLTLEPGVYTITLGSGAGSAGSGLIEVIEMR